MVIINGKEIKLGHDGLPANPAYWDAYAKFWREHYAAERTRTAKKPVGVGIADKQIQTTRRSQ